MINIISNYWNCQQLRDLKGFKLDLGRSYINQDRAMEIQDPFVKHQVNLRQEMIYKFGQVGPISIYYSHTYPNNELEIWGNNNHEKYNTIDQSPKEILANWIKKLDKNHEPSIS